MAESGWGNHISLFCIHRSHLGSQLLCSGQSDHLQSSLCHNSNWTASQSHHTAFSSGLEGLCGDSTLPEEGIRVPAAKEEKRLGHGDLARSGKPSWRRSYTWTLKEAQDAWSKQSGGELQEWGCLWKGWNQTFLSFFSKKSVLYWLRAGWPEFSFQISHLLSIHLPLYNSVFSPKNGDNITQLYRIILRIKWAYL